METISIRNLRGKALREKAASGKPLAITNHRALIGVLIPVAAAWVEQLIDYNWSHVRQSIAEGDRALAEGQPMIRLEDVFPAVGDSAPGPGPVPDMPETMAAPLFAALTGEALAQSAGGQEVLEQLRSALAPPRPHGAEGDSPTSVRTVRIGDLSAGLIEKAGQAGQTLAITHERELIGIMIPVTQGLVEFLIEQNVSRALANITRGEMQLRVTGKLTSLDEVLDPPEKNPGSPSPPAAASRDDCAAAQP